MSLSNTIRQRVLVEFEPAQVEQVIQLLEQYGFANSEAESERVHAGILELARGDINAVHQLVQAAKQDYRNMLYMLSLDEKGAPSSPPGSQGSVSVDIDGTPPAIAAEILEQPVKLIVLESPDHEEREVAVNPGLDLIQAEVRQLPWDDISFVVAKIDEQHWFEGSGSLSPDDGLSSVCCVAGTEYVISAAPESLDDLIALIHSFVKKDGAWRNMVEWS